MVLQGTGPSVKPSLFLFILSKKERENMIGGKAVALVLLAVAAALLALTTVCSGSAFAVERENTFTISPMLGGYLFEGDQHLKSSPNYGASVGYNITDNVGAEAAFNFVDSGFRAGHGTSQVDVFLYRLEGLYHFTNWGRLQPFVAAGAGAAVFSPDPGSTTAHALIDYGGGLEYFITDRIAVRGDVRHVITFDHTYNNLSYTAGITVLLGGKRAPAVAEVPGPMERAITGEKPPEVKPQPQAAKPPEKPKQVCLELKVNFDFNKADIKPEFESEVKKVADFMKANPEAHGTVVGYTDEVGPKPYNQELAQRRAQAVKDYLVKNYGIATDRLDIEGKGKTDFVASNLTEQGRAENRRAVRVFCSTGKEMAPPKPKQVCVGMKVQFDTNSAKIKPEYEPEMKRVADYMKEHPDQVGTIEGYADWKGPGSYNMKLSQRRADAVRDYMIKRFGIPTDRLKTRAFGEARPVGNNRTAAGRAENRYAVEMFCEPAGGTEAPAQSPAAAPAPGAPAQEQGGAPQTSNPEE